MSAELFRIAAAGGSIEEAALSLIDQLDTDDLGDLVLARMIVQLARTIDAAGTRGRASAAAMAAKELREAVADIRDRHAGPTTGPEEEFAHFRDYMIDLVREPR